MRKPVSVLNSIAARKTVQTMNPRNLYRYRERISSLRAISVGSKDAYPGGEIGQAARDVERRQSQACFRLIGLVIEPELEYEADADGLSGHREGRAHRSKANQLEENWI